jgi:primosomal protein N''
MSGDISGRTKRRKAGRRSLTVTELAEEVRESNRRLTETIDRLGGTVHDLEVAVRKLLTRVAFIDDRLASPRKAAWALALWALGMLGSAFYVAHRATQLEDTVAALQTNFAEFKADSKARDKQIADSLAALQSSSQARDDRLDRALNSLDRIEKILTKPRSANP